MGLENAMSKCEHWAMSLLVHNRLIPIEETIAKVDVVNKDKVQNFAKKLLANPLTLAGLGPLQHLESLDKIRSRLN
jgi:predicted Zn-dependent peptidase